MREMKDSGVEWLGSIPDEWEVKRVGSLFRERKQQVSANDHIALSVTKKGVVPQLDSAAKSDATETRKLIRKGDFVINSRSDRKGSSGLADRDGSCSSIYIVLEPLGFSGDFAHQLFRSQAFQEEFYRWGTGIVDDLWSTRYSSMKMISIPLPPTDELVSIVAYLNKETSQIDALISKKEQLIEKLLERRQALITQVVTKGLDPNVPMKDSGVEWLGEVPESWTVPPLWTQMTFSTGWTPPSKDESNFGGQHPWVNISDIGQREIKETQKTLSDQGARVVSQKPVPIGSLLFSFKLSIGQVSFAGCELFTNEAIASFSESGSRQVSLDFAFYMLPVAVPENCSWNIYGAPMLNESRIRQARIIVPPQSDQAAIAAHLDKETTQIDTLVEKTRKAIDLLKERRQALITQVVTGKIDVRGVAGGNS
jgi:type I restriction enzyme, S subunit